MIRRRLAFAWTHPSFGLDTKRIYAYSSFFVLSFFLSFVRVRGLSVAIVALAVYRGVAVIEMCTIFAFLRVCIVAPGPRVFRVFLMLDSKFHFGTDSC